MSEPLNQLSQKRAGCLTVGFCLAKAAVRVRIPAGALFKGGSAAENENSRGNTFQLKLRRIFKT